MRKLVGTSILMLMAFSAHAAGFGDISGAFAGRIDTYGSGRDGQAKQLDDVLLQVSDYMNKRMPEVVGDNKRLDRVSAEPGAHFSYHYTLLAQASSDIDKATFSNSIRKELKGTLCDSLQVRNFLNHGVTVSYIYQSSDGVPVGTAEFAPNSCENAKEPATKP